MNTKPQFYSRILSYVLAGLLMGFPLIACSKPASRHKVQVLEENNFQNLATQMRERKLPVLVEFHADHCPYCRQLEEDFLRPMLLSGEYEDKILIRQVELDYGNDIIDFQGKKISANTFSSRYKAYMTPTMVFLDANGNEVAEKIVGINTPSLFGGYIDIEIEKALKKIRAENPSQ